MEEVVIGKALIVASIFSNRLVGRKFLNSLLNTLLSIIKNLMFTYLDSCEINCDSRFIVKFYLQEKNNNKKSLVELILGNLEEKE